MMSPLFVSPIMEKEERDGDSEGKTSSPVRQQNRASKGRGTHEEENLMPSFGIS